ncbi:homeodomain-interacting protein kinase 1-like [Hippoglossus stenolepis]|uniref:homeodomain-interacting protein kinase 1-like n=1 Tax=Hippoglossus stenolepis TaxID=195615 RepID=UPI001FAFFB1C|nr:homeodomain-interacting protein kinase 1-like [Hippoglossus stenolepis]
MYQHVTSCCVHLISSSTDKPLKPKKTFRDRVEKFFGKGRFGKVVECVDTKTDENVAIKMTTDYFQENARKEAADADRSHIIVHDEPTCPSFEVVDVTLDEYLKDVKFMTISEIRPVLQQLATALLCLEDLDIVHSDIKPENIMVLDKWQKPLQVKLIEFGLARQGPDIHPGSGGQSLLYRAPEVMLGLRHRQPIDMWSVGLTVAEMALGRPLLPGKHEYDIMKKIVKTLGEPPTDQLDAGPRSMQYFNICGTWRLKVCIHRSFYPSIHPSIHDLP